MGVCSIDGCSKPVAARGWCGMHYIRWKKSGDPLVVVGRRIIPEEERFWTKVNKDGPVPDARPDLGPCWLWTGGKDGKGYGNFTRADRSSARAHRWSYEHEVGPVPEGLCCDHLCRVRACVRPSHLDPCTPIENTRRGDTGGKFHRDKTHCPAGHPYNEANTYYYTKPGGALGRMCRECRRAASRKRNLARIRKPRVPKTHCPHGHPYDEANTIERPKPSGTIVKVCRTCKNAEQAAARVAGRRP